MLRAVADGACRNPETPSDVRDLGMAYEPDPRVAGIYLPLDLPSVGSVYLAARISGDMYASTQALRRIAVRTDQLLRLASVQSLDRMTADASRVMDFWLHVLLAVSASALVLALSGIYAVTSFAVSRRTREIGIRIAPPTIWASTPLFLGRTVTCCENAALRLVGSLRRVSA